MRQPPKPDLGRAWIRMDLQSDQVTQTRRTSAHWATLAVSLAARFDNRAQPIIFSRLAARCCFPIKQLFEAARSLASWR